MSYHKQDLIRYRLEKSATTFDEADFLMQNGFWGGAANRLYYCSFYAVTALLAKDEIEASTHNGVRTEFFKQYIKTGILNREYSNLYSNLMSKRHESDYDDFIEFSESEILPLLEEVRQFLLAIREQIEI